jgi:hypothetical protein
MDFGYEFDMNLLWLNEVWYWFDIKLLDSGNEYEAIWEDIIIWYGHFLESVNEKEAKLKDLIQ